MGGDNAPLCVVEGANLALGTVPYVHFKLFGNEAELAPLLARFPKLAARSEIIHTPDKVASDAKPSVALRQGAKSSMRLAINAVKDGQAHGVVSSGNTGALLAMSKVALKTLPGIKRPALCSTLPTVKDNIVMLDMGANIEVDVETLCQFAIMGDAFARIVLGLEKPVIGLLNVGAEEIKGNDLLRSAHHILKHVPHLNYIGFCEGNDIGKGDINVVVADGFTGNITLKTIEGTAQFVATSLKRALTSSLCGKLGYALAATALKPFRAKMDPRQHNGAVFIGLNGITVKSHGNADAIAFANAIQVTHELLAHDVNGKIMEELSRTPIDTLLHHANDSADSSSPEAGVQ